MNYQYRLATVNFSLYTPQPILTIKQRNWERFVNTQ